MRFRLHATQAAERAPQAIRDAVKPVADTPSAHIENQVIELKEIYLQVDDAVLVPILVSLNVRAMIEPAVQLHTAISSTITCMIVEIMFSEKASGRECS